MAAALSVLAINPYPVRARFYAIRHACAMLPQQRIKRPIGIGNHPNPALATHQDRVIGRKLAGVHDILRGFEDPRRVVNESVHTEVSQNVPRYFTSK